MNRCELCESTRVFRRDEYDVCLDCDARSYDGETWIRREGIGKVSGTMKVTFAGNDLTDFCDAVSEACESNRSRIVPESILSDSEEGKT